jgi:site-specific DNA-methyltransferase (adenine-specific)
MVRLLPGQTRVAICGYLRREGKPRTVAQIRAAVTAELGPVADSTVRSYLNLNRGKLFERVSHGVYRIIPGGGC